MRAYGAGIGTAVALVFFPIAALGLALPPLPALALAGGLGAATALAVTRMRPARTRSRARALLDVREALTRLDAARSETRSMRLRRALDEVCDTGEDMARRAAGGGSLGGAERALTHYIPRAACLAAFHRMLEDNDAEPGRRRRLECMMECLAKAVALSRAAAREEDLRQADLELKLIEDALREDFA